MIIVVLSDRCVILDTAGNPYYIVSLIVQASGYFNISHTVCSFIFFSFCVTEFSCLTVQTDYFLYFICIN